MKWHLTLQRYLASNTTAPIRVVRTRRWAESMKRDIKRWEMPLVVGISPRLENYECKITIKKIKEQQS